MGKPYFYPVHHDTSYIIKYIIILYGDKVLIDRCTTNMYLYTKIYNSKVRNIFFSFTYSYHPIFLSIFGDIYILFFFLVKHFKYF